MIVLSQNKPKLAIIKPIKIIFQAPNLSVRKPSIGPSNAPPNLPNDETPDTIALDQPNSSSIALNIMLPQLNVGILEIAVLRPPNKLIHHP